ncbi:hypothetical protein EPR50_G00193940 [Perca flavescens]|uniref:Ig-like domain-containing protein n=1 Tax=Perca flavescens TaxID=8167 RepID=A0A484CCB6_PERFV|nr:Fc receptor-like protein 5 [Perca flavescens]TDG99397.1 hypothetical protein EPR50_G00193940 [Perca flavescens]
MQLTPFCLVLSCLQISPDMSQFFRYETVTLRCEDPLNSTGWKVKRKTPEGGVRPCTAGWGTAFSSSTCVIKNTYPSDTGTYWCESAGGERSNGVNITVTDRNVLLESPGLPVLPGAAVTLRCKTDTPFLNHTYDFHKDGRVIGSSSTGEMTLQSVSKSDEGLYVCSIPGYEESLGNWMAVEGPPLPSSSAPPAASFSLSFSRVLFHLLVGTPYVVSTILLGLIYRDRNRAAGVVAERRGSNDVIMEIVV